VVVEKMEEEKRKLNDCWTLWFSSYWKVCKPELSIGEKKKKVEKPEVVQVVDLLC
jgi:hypothetical protein